MLLFVVFIFIFFNIGKSYALCGDSIESAYEACRQDIIKCRLNASEIDAYIRFIAKDALHFEMMSSHFHVIEKLTAFGAVSAPHYTVRYGGAMQFINFGIWRISPQSRTWHIIDGNFSSEAHRCLIDPDNPHGDIRNIYSILEDAASGIGFNWDGDQEALTIPSREAVNLHIVALNKKFINEGIESIPVYYYGDETLPDSDYDIEWQVLRLFAGHGSIPKDMPGVSIGFPMAKDGIRFFHDLSYHLGLILLPPKLLLDLKIIAHGFLIVLEEMKNEDWSIKKKILEGVSRGIIDMATGNFVHEMAQVAKDQEKIGNAFMKNFSPLFFDRLDQINLCIFSAIKGYFLKEIEDSEDVFKKYESEIKTAIGKTLSPQDQKLKFAPTVYQGRAAIGTALQSRWAQF